MIADCQFPIADSGDKKIGNRQGDRQ